MSKQHWIVTFGDGGSCGHRHRSYSRAVKCCRSWINEQRSYFQEDWRTNFPEMLWSEYVTDFCDEAIFIVDDAGNLWGVN